MGSRLHLPKQLAMRPAHSESVSRIATHGEAVRLQRIGQEHAAERRESNNA